MLICLPRLCRLGLLKSTACVPLDSLKACKRIVAQSVQAATKGHSPACSCSIRMVIIGVERSMVVEVLLNVDDRDVIFREQLADAGGVGLLISRNIVAV